MLRTLLARAPARTSSLLRLGALNVQSRSLADQNPVHDAAEKAGAKKETSPKNPSAFSSAGAVGKQFNPDGAIGQVAEEVGGPFSKDGAVGSQFDAAKGGVAGTVEKAVDGPSQAKK
ncbi:hypothetical protein MMC34_000283 [Xylographa carneopallida]|nr:hypothetical protein [Xylographa carneopallida]